MMASLTPLVAALVLSAAVMHASWNALVKSVADKVAMQTLVTLVAAVLVVPGLFFVPLPEVAAWPFLVLSTVVHAFYYAALLNSYRFGDLSQVYPIARGASPLIIALGAWLFAGEALGRWEWLGLLIVSAGIMSLTAARGRRRDGEVEGIGFAFATGLTIALYSIADGMGVRRTAEPLSYVLWLLLLQGLPMIAFGLWQRRGRFIATARATLWRGLGGGVVLGLGYGIVIWAMQRAPMAHVSALRETSVILATVIGATLLHEPFGRRRALAAVLVAGGNALLHLAG
jgi:drug/metabolite transporter (DMT)-like permease